MAPAAAQPVVERRAAYAFADFVLSGHEERSIATETWLADICKAAWATKEAMRIAAMISTHVRDSNPYPMILKDIESILSIPKEEVNRMFKMMKLFGVYEKYDVEGPGNIVLSLRLSAVQKLHIRETKRQLDALNGIAPVDMRSTPAAPLPAAVEPAPVAIQPEPEPAPQPPAAAVTHVAEPAAAVSPADAAGPLAARVSSLQQRLRAAAEKS